MKGINRLQKKELHKMKLYSCRKQFISIFVVKTTMESKTIMHIKFCCFIFLLLSVIGRADAGPIHGLMFRSKEVRKEYRTGIDITHFGALSFKESLSISFDISFREGEDRFGYIFRLKDEKSQWSFDLVAKLDRMSPSLFLVADKSEAIAEIPIDSATLYNTNHWHSISFHINTASGAVSINALGNKIEQNLRPFKAGSAMLLFGTSPDGWWMSDETPPMSIRNLSITTDNQTPYFWPMTKTGSLRVKDSNRGKKALLTNPAWDEDNHTAWTHETKIRFDSQPLVTWDEYHENLLIVRNNGIILRYHPASRTTDTLTFTGGRFATEEMHQLIADSLGITAYSLNYPVISTFLPHSHRWSYDKDIPAGLPRFWHHNKLRHPITGDITAIAGYGFYTYNNTIQSFDPQKGVWNQLHFTGDTILPRYLSALGLSKAAPKYGYLFGGLGNPSGKQVLGKEFYYDFYLIDFKKQIIRRLWQLQQRPQKNFTPVNSLVIDDADSCFYTLVFAHERQQTVLRTIKASLQNPDFQIVANDIPFSFIDIASFASLYRWNSANKLLALTVEKDEGSFVLNLYSILNPPANSSTTKNLGILNLTTIIIAIFATLFAAFLIFKIALTRRKTSSQTTGIQPLTNPTIAPHIRLLGSFAVTGIDGNDITHLFSPTVKELFLLILIHNTENGKGISSAAIQEALWSDKSEASARNNRGVNIKKLRDVLSEMGNNTIIYDNGLWFIELDEKVECDYIFVKQTIAAAQKSNEIDQATLSRLVFYLQSGTPFNEIKAEWSDNFKDSFTAEVVLFLENQIDILKHHDDASITIELCNTIFVFDRLNEKALSAKCRLLSKTGRNTLAREAYDSFCRLYLKSYGEEYKTGFQQLIKQKN